MQEQIFPVMPYVRPDRRTLDIEFAMNGLVTCGEFHSVRNSLLAVLRQFGSVGPMGEFSIKGDCKSLSSWDEKRGPVTSRRPDYFVVSDQYNQRDRFHRVEADPRMLKAGLLGSLISMLQNTKGWIVYIALMKGGLVVSSTSIGYEGNGFSGCESIADLELRCKIPQ